MTYKSPIIYFGSKYRIIDEIIRYCPENIYTVHDVFAGAFNVGANIPAKIHVCNDVDTRITEVLKLFRDFTGEAMCKMIEKRIEQFNLTSMGQDAYNVFRKEYNSSPNPLDLFVLHIFSFCHAIRFNSKGEFNMPIGKGYFNDEIRQNVKDFCIWLNMIKVRFTNMDYATYIRSMDITKNDLVYCDPPYLISDAPYNCVWNEDKERLLYRCLDELSRFGNRFMLSNILFHKGHKNEILEDFINRGNYYVAHLDIQMYNKNFCNTDVEQATDTDEVIVTNYDITKMLPKKPRNLW